MPAVSPSRWTLRTKLVCSVLLLFILVTAAVGALTVLRLKATLTTQVDNQLALTASTISPNSEGGGRQLPPPPTVGNTSIQVTVTADGSVVSAEGRGGYIAQNFVSGYSRVETSLSSAQIATLRKAGLGIEPTVVDLGPTLGRFRVVAVIHSIATQNIKTGQVTPNTPVVTMIGLPVGGIDDAVRQMALTVALLSAAGLILVGGAAGMLIRRSLAPLRRVAATASRVSQLPLSSGQVDMHERVPAVDTDPRTEVGQVGAALNDMLDHVDSALTARQISEMKVRQFVADASHELRTPLASIKGYAELSRRERDPVPADVSHALNRIESEAGRMTSLVEDLLLLARLDNGRPLEKAPVDITRLAIETVSDAHAAGPRHEWKLDLPDAGLEVLGDEARVRQVFINLLANARRHTRDGTTITTGVRPADGHAVISVCDNGPGIPPDLMPHIFERFTRGDSARTRTEGSTGLGLSIVHAVVTAHHGWVTVKSRPGDTRFEIWLPALAGPPRGDPDSHPREDWATPGTMSM
ncbi:HAMP domain-containing protein [Leekyejoonella antrihumi]|uniref:histidine kinase n=1 Tax=Leekyejoonella antrihumi TaxID=1660198 RepID=A0A563E783_9MICO|nr:HAMP domain-containing protein [Leekyejoonella antrihumi]